MSNYNPGINWSDDEIGSTDKLNAMVENTNIVYNLIPEAVYRSSTGGTTEFNEVQSMILKPKIIGGIYKTSGLASNYGQTRAIGFPSGTFASGCNPVVQVTAAGTGHERYITTTIAGLDNSLVVGPSGFKVQIYHRDGEKFQSEVYIHYLAFGWTEV